MAFRGGVLIGVLAFLTALVAPLAAEDGWVTLSDNFEAWTARGEWFSAADARLDPANDRHLLGEPGHGVIINGPKGAINDLVSRQQYGDFQVSLEFMIPRHSNSGVKLEGVYEVQIFDSWKVAKPTGSDCGGIYPRAEQKPHYHTIDDGVPPRVNAAKAPGQWQTLEIAFRAPRFDAKGQKVANARFERVVLNGKLIHEQAEARTPTGHIWRQQEKPTGPLLLQGDHGPVAFRNIRVRPLAAAK
jgi:hypothetical protein